MGGTLTPLRGCTRSRSSARHCNDASCPYFDGFDVQGKVCPWEYGGDYKGTASCGGSISEGWTCSLWHGIPGGSGVDLQAYVDSVHGAGYCAKNPSGDPCVGWGIYGPGCTC